MRKELLMVTAGAILFNLIFWQEKFAMNALIFDAFILASLFYLYPDSKKDTTVRWLLFGHLVSLGMLLLHNTILSKCSFVATLALLAAFAEYSHRSPWYAGGSFISNVVSFLFTLGDTLFLNRPSKKSNRSWTKWLRFLIFPLGLLAVFFVIYQLSNHVFAVLAARWTLWFEQVFSSFASWFSFDRLLFLLMGFYLVGSILLKAGSAFFQKKESVCSDDLLRNKLRFKKQKSGFISFISRMVLGKFAGGNLALKNEYTIGVISLLLLNVLLLVINVIDISYVWFNFEFTPDQNLYLMVHEGTELLILSIILAMLVLIFFFKGNLNFYQANRWLKWGAYAWIIQNTILVISVFLRDYYYIVYYGLAYKRIGVLFFLLAVLTGLITVLIKIRYRKTNYFLFRVNAWAVIILLIASSTVNWDERIAEYNFNNSNRVAVDLQFLFSLSDKTLPVIDKHLNGYTFSVPNLSDRNSRNNLVCQSCYLEKFKQRKQRFLEQEKVYSWLSWNYADAYILNYFVKKQQDGSSASSALHKSSTPHLITQ